MENRSKWSKIYRYTFSLERKVYIVFITRIFKLRFTCPQNLCTTNNLLKNPIWDYVYQNFHFVALFSGHRNLKDLQKRDKWNKTIGESPSPASTQLKTLLANKQHKCHLISQQLQKGYRRTGHPTHTLHAVVSTKAT